MRKSIKKFYTLNFYTLSFTLCSQTVESGFNQYGTSETPLEGNSQGSCGPNGCASTVILDSGLKFTFPMIS